MVDGVAAARQLLSLSSVSPGYCLNYVWLAYKSVGARTNRSAQTATNGWYASDGKHPGDRNPPPGAAVWWGRRTDGNMDGDVTISLGGGQIAATDWPYSGVTGQTTLDQRQAQIRREYLGWTECIFDVPVLPGSGKDDTPDVSKEDIMAGPVYLNVPNGPRAVVDVAAGIFTPRTEEEAQAAATIFGGKDISQRQFDVALNLTRGLHDQFVSDLAGALGKA